MSVREAAQLLEVSERTVQRSLKDEEQRATEWGREGQGWRYKPLSTRGIYQLRRSVVERMAAGLPPVAEDVREDRHDDDGGQDQAGPAGLP